MQIYIKLILGLLFILSLVIFFNNKQFQVDSIYLSVVLIYIIMLLIFYIGRLTEKSQKPLEINSKHKDMELDFNTILDHSNDFFYMKDSQYKFRAVNDNFAKLTGHQHWSQIVGKTDFDVFPKEDAQKYRDDDENVIERGEPVLARLESYPMDDGTEGWVQTSKIPIVDEDGKVIRMFGFSTDVTELIKSREVANEANQAKSEFLSNMSHEIRTPINAVMGMLYLASKTELNDLQKNYVSKARNGAESLIIIINDILDFSKIEAGKLSIEQRDFNLDEVILHVSDIVSNQVDSKDVELVVKYDPEIPKILVGDSLRLGQILINIANNAMKFTEQGEVFLSQKLLSRDDEHITIQFCVKDSGIGMSEEDQKNLFHEFTQVDSSTSRKYGGTGLGLTISKKLVEMMHGRIWIESSEKGVGTTVCFSVRLKTSYNSMGNYTSHKSLPETFTSMNVLIVDDNISAQEVLFEMLTSFKLNVEMVSSGKEAISILEESAKVYDLVFMDWQMPVMDGRETIREIHKSKKITKQPKIIMLTVSTKEEIMHEANEVGIDAYLIKPVSPSLVFDTIMQVFRFKVAHDIEESKDVSLESIAGSRVLLAEDNQLNQELALALLQSKGLIVDLAEDGVIALRMAQEKRYDCILMDIQMPEMDGLSATRRIRALALEKKEKYYAELPIIAMTANAMSDDREKSIAAGMNEHVTKPIDPDEICNVLLKFIGLSKDSELKKVEIDSSMLKGVNTDASLHRFATDKYSNISNEIQKDKLLEEKASIELVNRSKSEFLENMSHEIRTPINAVLGFADLLEETELSAKQRNYVSSIIKGTDGLLDVINDLLGLSKMIKTSTNNKDDFSTQLQTSLSARFTNKKHPYKLLIVDDNDENVTLLSEILSFKDLTLKKANSGRGATELFSQWKPDLIFMDYRMPEMNGIEAIERIRSLPDGDKCKIVMLTGSASEKQDNEYFLEYCDDVIAKPYRSSTIYEVLQKQLSSVGYDASKKEKTTVKVDEKTQDFLKEYTHDMKQPLSRLNGVLMTIKSAYSHGALDQEKLEEKISKGYDAIEELSHYIEKLRDTSIDKE